MAGLQNAQSFPNDPGRAPAEFPDQEGKPLSRKVIKSCLN